MISLLGYTKKTFLAFLAVISAAGLQQAIATNFIIEDQTLAGDATTVTVPIKVSDFANVGAMQMTISWDPAVLTYSSLGDFDHSTAPTELFFFGESNFNTDFVGDGNLAVLYEQILSLDASIVDDETIFSITFDVIGGNGSSTAVSFTDVPTPRKLASFLAANPDFVSQNGTIQIGTGVTDTIAPVITLTGAASVTHELGTTYTDAGATSDGGETVTTTGTVDANTAGTYTLTYTATDAAGNAATAVTRTVTVTVSDTTAPVITLTGAASVTHELGTTYPDAGATSDGGETVTTTGTVDANTAGTYTLTYTATDAAGNAATAVTRTVTVTLSDTTAPVITLTGAASVTHELGTTYTDAGATSDGGETVTTTGTVDANTAGTYTLTYTATDAAGNSATAVTRTVDVLVIEVIDTVTFTIEDQTLAGDATTVTVPIKVSDFANVGAMQMTISWDPAVLTYSSLGDFDHSTAPTELFFFGESNFNTGFVGDGSVLYEQILSADASIVDDETIFSITFDVIGGNGSSTAVSFTDVPTPRKLASFAAANPDFVSQNGTIQIGTPVDTTPPVITLTGDASLTIEAGTTYTDAGATATDDVDDPVAVTKTGAVNTAVPGTYTLTYSASDVAENAAAEVTRTVVVVDTTAPVITLSGELNQGGANFMDQEAGVAFVEPGATATDNVDGAVTVITTGSVDENTPDTYVLTYTAIDAAGNEATSLTRTVVVADRSRPVITLLGAAEMDVLFNADFTDPGSTVSDSFENGLTAIVTGEVDTSIPGTYTLTYNVSDSAGNAAAEVQRTVHVVDQQGPVITLNGDASVNHEAGTVYADAGATATDNVDTTVTVDTTGAVDADVPGTYILTYTASDSEGNEATPVTRTVVVADTTPPVITLVDAASLNHEAGVDYVDAGASVTDSFDTSVTVTTVGTVNVNAPETYTLTYSASDAAGNAAAEVTRTVVVADTIAPVITLVGNATVNHEAGTVYEDAGANAEDSFDATVTVTPLGTVDENTPGTYTVTYNASDIAGNEATSLTRTVEVADTIAPVITLLGAAEMDVLFNADFTDPGSTVSDSFENGLTAIVTGEVDTSIPGTYTLTYNVSDSAGNAAAEVQRTVHVVDQQGPVITLNGDASVNHEAGTVYEDAGATATDNVDTTVTIDTTGAVDADVPGTYTLTYTASDSEGNEATPVTRTVVVADTTPPVITLVGDAIVDLNEGTLYTDAGATVADSFDTTVTVIDSGEVDETTPGSYTLTYNATDAAGNAATTVTRTVLVIDTVTFIIQDQLLAGDASVTVPIKVSSFANVGGMQFTLTWDPSVLKFSSLGDFNHSAENSELLAFGQSNFNLAEASNGKLPVLYEHPGSSDGSVEDNETIFSVTFDVLGELGSSTAIIFGDDPTPSKMGSFDAAVAPVFLSQGGNISLGEDTVAPVITLVGDSSVNHEAGTTYDDAGAVASDNSGESMTVTTTGIVNGNPPGSYTLTYNASDSAGNAATAVTRTVLIADTIAPEITLEGEPVMTVAVGGGFTDPGSTVSDIFEDGLTATVTGDVNDTISGVYTLNYNVSDSAGNPAVQVTRTVNVTDQTAPVITLSGPLNQGGANFMDQEAGVAFVEPGAIATDNVDGTVTVTTTGSVDVSTPGTYTLTYTAIDAAGNEATPATRTVVVADTIAPVITLLGSAEMDVLFNAPFTDPGSNVSDSFESGLTATATGTVNTAEVGTYTLNYNVSDSAGNAAAEVQRTVHVVDQQGPVISLNGTATVNHEATTTYTDAGASATDNVDATVIVTTSGEVNVNVPDTYTLTYNATDSEGNPATPVIRTVVVVDLASPVIALTGENPLNHEAGVAYLDAGATATDNVDSVVTVTTTGTVDINSIGSNTLTYDASDVAGNAATPVTRTVLVADNTPPVVTLLGDDVMTVLLESAFVDPGATVQDSFDTGLLASVAGSVDTSTLGTYTLTYSASDNSGNAAQEVTRTVLVVDDTTPPVITLLGAPFSLHEAGTPFTDPGAEGSDNRDGNITSSIQKSGNVNVQTIGDYELKYDLVDAAGNEAQQKTRTVQVNDSIAPEISLVGESSLEHEAGTEYTDQGSIVTDSFENGLIAEVTGSVDSSKLGTYTLTFNATDSSDNSAAAVTRTVSVVDTTPPVIALLGEATLTLAVGDTFTDPGSSVSDSFEEGLTATVVGNVNTSKPESYQLTYSVQDSSQNAASEVVRTVIVEDQTAPIITLNGDVDVIHEAGLVYLDAGVTVTDNVDTTVDVTITGIVDENSLGTYTLTYSASDAAGNPATAVTREVSVTDTIAPVVALLGESEITHIIGTSYSDSGAEVVDSFETDLTAELTGDVNVEELGVYTLSYSAKDSSGNEATPVERKVTVTDGLEVTQITSTSTQISENGGQSDITVYLSQPALAESTLLSVVATPASRVKVPATFPVFAGLEKIEFSIEGLDDSDSNGDELVSIQLKTAYRELGEPIELTIQDDDLEAPVIGTVSDGLISGATVFFDRNANRVLDADEPSTQTDNRGAYQLDLPASLYDINGDDVVDSADGVIVARGGIDTATGLTLETPLLAPPSATVINPITTLVSNMIESDASLDADNAAALVQSSLGIGGVDVLNFDMFEEAGNENPAATEVIKAAAKVQDTIVQAGSFISGASTISKAASYNLISEILVKKIKEQQPIELNDVATLESVVEEAAVKAQVVIAPESIKGAAAIISDSNQLKESAVDAAESVAKAAQEISRVQGHAQSESQSDLADLGAGIQSLEALEIKYEAENLEKLVQETAVGPVSGVDERVGTFVFSSANYEVNESGEAVSQIKVTREDGNLGVVDLLVTPQGLTASPDEDFVATSIEVRFDDQEITKTLSLVGVLIDDQVSDAGESFTLQLALKEQGDSPAKIGSIAEAEIQIIDNDFAGTFQFKVVSNTFSEAETGEQYLVVERFGGNSGEVTLELSEESLAGGATSGVDYTYSQSSITFGDGVLQRKVSVNLIDDELLETDESFRLTLSLPTGDTSGALIGSNASTEILIQSDEVDQPPVIGAIADIQMLEDGAEITTSFTVGDDYTPLDRLRITVSSANRSIIPGQNLRLTPGGDAGEWELRILPLTNTYGVVPLSVRVSDGSNLTTTEFSVIIGGQNDAPSISAIPAMIDAVGKQVVIPFQLSDIDDQPEDLLVYFDTSQVDYVAARHVDVKGAGMQRELVINPTGLATGTGFFKLIVVDSDGARFSRAFTVHFGGEFPAPVVPQLGIARDGSGGLILNWEGDALLYISRDLSGVFEELPNAVSPYRLDMSGNAFFKLGLKP